VCHKQATGDNALHHLHILINFLWLHGVQLPDAPLYYSLSSLASVMKLSSIPSRLFQAAVLNAGYKVHFANRKLVGQII
jgi:hypothetical protein